MSNRHIGLGGTLCGLLVFSGIALAQLPDNVPHVGWLQNGAPTNPSYEAFRQQLRDLGYVEGRNIKFDIRSAGGDFSRLPALAKELAGLGVSVIYVGGDQGLRAAKQASNTIPIVALTCDLPSAFIVSLARPGGKATGVTCSSSDLAGKRLQLLREMLPRVSRVGVMYNPKDLSKPDEFKELRDVAGKLGIAVEPIEILEKPEALTEEFSKIRAARVQALIILVDAFTGIHQRRLGALAASNHLPAMYGFRDFTEAGGLISYGANTDDMQRRAATYVDRILKGAKPADLPVEQPTKFELAVNLKAAKILGIKVPQSILLRADRVIE